MMAVEWRLVVPAWERSQPLFGHPAGGQWTQARCPGGVRADGAARLTTARAWVPPATSRSPTPIQNVAPWLDKSLMSLMVVTMGNRFENLHDIK